MAIKKVRKIHINITIDEDLNARIEKIATELRLNKSQLINNLLSMSMGDVNILKKTGLLRFAKAVRDSREKGLKVNNKGIALEDSE